MVKVQLNLQLLNPPIKSNVKAEEGFLIYDCLSCCTLVGF